MREEWYRCAVAVHDCVGEEIGSCSNGLSAALLPDAFAGPRAGLCHGKRTDEAADTVLGLVGMVDEMFAGGVEIMGWQCWRIKAPSN